MRRTRWAVFTSMNPRSSVWRALDEVRLTAAAGPHSLAEEPVEDRNRREPPVVDQEREHSRRV
jgi:hypothetical protein